MDPKFSTCILLLPLLLAFKAPPDAHSAFIAPGRGAWVDVETVQPRPGTDQLLPTLRLRLETSESGGSLVVLDGVLTLCGTDVVWTDAGHLTLRLPEAHLHNLRVHDGQVWKGIEIQVLIHEDQIGLESVSPDRRFRLVVLKECESENWNLYLRTVGEPLYNQAVGTGWNDPDLFGGGTWVSPAVDLEWTGPRSACIEVANLSLVGTRRTKLMGISLEWVNDDHYRPPPLDFHDLGSLTGTGKIQAQSTAGVIPHYGGTIKAYIMH